MVRRPQGYRIWDGMLQRIRNPKCESFKDYGGRGIRVCAEWISFKRFWADMGPTYQPGLTLDRIDNDGNYEPGNCRWATRLTQARNQKGWRKHRNKYRGVCWHKHAQSWRAVVTIGRTIHLGYFSSDIDAARAYDVAAKNYFGPTAILNFPE
jgi:hypothetical protein